MATHVQILLPLLCADFAQAHFISHLHFGDWPLSLPGLPREHQHSDSSEVNSDESWFHHNWPRHTHRPHDKFNPFRHRGRDPYKRDPYDNLGPMPGINNIFNIPGMPGYDSQKRKPSRRGDHHESKNGPKVDLKGKHSDDKHQHISPIDNKKSEGVNCKLINTDSGMQNKPDELPPKINENQMPGDILENVNLTKKKDYLLVGRGNNANNIYLLKENKPNPTIPNTNQAGQNGVAYNPGQATKQVHPVVAQPAPLPNPVAQEKINTNGYNNANLNSNQNSGYVMVYSNGQLLKIPGVVVQNNVPQQNGYPVQGTQYIIANSIPTNTQNGAVSPNPVQNSGGPVIYAVVPNQQANAPIVLQIPNYVHNIPSNNVCGSGAVVQNVVKGVNSAPAGCMTGNQPIQNVGAQQAELLQNGASNSCAQPNSASDQGQGQNQNSLITNQNGPFQPPVKVPANSCSNEYNQPMTNQRPSIAVNAPNQGGEVTNPNTALQPAIELRINPDSNGYNQPIGPNQGPNVVAMQPSQGNQGSSIGIVNTPSQDEVPNDNNENMVLDSSNISSIGAQPAIMISNYKDTKADTKDENKTKSEADKSKKKDKKNKEAAKSVIDK